MSVAASRQVDPELNRTISDAMVELYAIFYQHDRTTATTYINDNIVVCVLENILTAGEDTLIAEGARGEVIDGRVAFQTDSEDEFTAAIERRTHRHVTAFLSANQTVPGVACELFFLDAAPLTAHGSRLRAIDVTRRDHKHASRRAAERTLAAHPTPGALADQVTNRDAADRLRALLTRLPDAQREVITLAFYGELTHTEIATALELPAGTVKGRMRLGLHKLREAIDLAAA